MGGAGFPAPLFVVKKGVGYPFGRNDGFTWRWKTLPPYSVNRGNLKSRSGQQKFLMKWYRDPRTGSCLHIIDDLGGRIAEQKKADRSLDNIKNLL